MQLGHLSHNSHVIGDKYLEYRGVTLYNRQARSTVIQDRNAYNQGGKDSEKIDVHRKRIEE